MLLRGKFLSAVAGAAMSVGVIGAASAGPVPQYPNLFDPTATPACISVGDFISCSAPLLNYYAGLDLGTNTPTGFVIHIPQGFLDPTIVIATGSGGNTADNTDVGSGIDNPFDSPNPQESWNTQSETEPAPTFTGDNTGFWDIQLQSLIDALTFDGAMHEMIIVLDHNQTGDEQSIFVWAMVTVRDLQCLDQSTCANPDVNFELTNDLSGFNVFSTTKDYGDLPSGLSEFLESAAFICVDDNGTPGNTVAARADDFVIQAGPDDCSGLTPAAGHTITEISNNLGTAESEFLQFLPELSANLLALLAAGYDVVSVNLSFEGANDGFEDLFIIAGRELTQVPEPSTLLAFASGLLGIAGLVAIRHRRRSH